MPHDSDEHAPPPASEGGARLASWAHDARAAPPSGRSPAARRARTGCVASTAGSRGIRRCAAPPTRSWSISATARARSPRSSCTRASPAPGRTSRCSASRSTRAASHAPAPSSPRCGGRNVVRGGRTRVVRARRVRGADARAAPRRHPRDERPPPVRRGGGRATRGERMAARLAPDGLLVEGTCDELGRIVHVGRDRDGCRPRRRSRSRSGSRGWSIRRSRRSGCRRRSSTGTCPASACTRSWAPSTTSGSARPACRRSDRCSGGRPRSRRCDGRLAAAGALPLAARRGHRAVERRRAAVTGRRQLRSAARRRAPRRSSSPSPSAGRPRAAASRRSGSDRRATHPAAARPGRGAPPRAQASRAIGSSEMSSSDCATSCSRPRELGEHVGRDRPRHAVVAEVDDAAGDDAQVAGREVHRLADPLVPCSSNALPAQERRDPRDREAGVERGRPVVHERLQRPRLLEPALGPHPVTAAQRLRRACSWPRRSRGTPPRPSRTSSRCGLRGMSAVTSSAATPPTTPSTRRRNGAFGRDHHDDERLDRGRDREARLRREEPGDDEREAQRQRELPPPRARDEQQELGDEDAHQHPEHRLEHAARPRVAHETEARDASRSRRAAAPDARGRSARRRRRRSRRPRSAGSGSRTPARAGSRVAGRCARASR